MSTQEESKAYKKFRNAEALEYCRKQAMLEQVVASENWKHYNTASEALEEVEQYRALGTVKELKEALEKQVAKKPIIKTKKSTETICVSNTYFCPACKRQLFQVHNTGFVFGEKTECCKYCGQKIDCEEGEISV